MKKLLYSFAVLSLIGAGAYAVHADPSPYPTSFDFGTTWSDSSHTTETVGASPTFDGKCYMFGIDPASHNPGLMQGPSRLTCDGGVIGLTTAESDVSFLSTDLGNLQANADSFGNQINSLQHQTIFNNSTTSLSYVAPSVVTSTGAVGTQISTDHGNNVHYNGTVTTTATISGPSQGYLVLEVAKTNSATASDWKEQARCGNGQTVTLALVLNSVQTTNCQLNGFVPPSNYYKVRSVTVSGSPSFSIDSGFQQSVQYGY